MRQIWFIWGAERVKLVEEKEQMSLDLHESVHRDIITKATNKMQL
jgi:hypothetical protein